MLGGHVNDGDGALSSVGDMDPGDEEMPDARLSLLRWAGACGILGLVLVAAVLSGIRSDRIFEVCERVPPSESAEADAPSTFVCRPLGIQDPQVVVGVLLAGLLLFPDLQRLKVGGLLEIERRANRAADAAQSAAERAETIAIRVEQFTQSAASSAATVVVQNNTLIPKNAEVALSPDALEEKGLRLL